MLIFKKEKEVAKLVETHVKTTGDCLTTAAKAIATYLESDLETAKELAVKVDAIESEADTILREIRDKLYLGAFMPLVREDIHKLVEAIDKVSNAGEDCCDFFLSQRPEIPAEMRDAFLEVLRTSFDSFSPLAEAMRTYFEPKGEIDDVRKFATRVGQQESRTDSLEWELTRTIFNSSLGLSQKLQLRLALDHIVEVSDRAEDASDQLELVSLKSVI